MDVMKSAGGLLHLVPGGKGHLSWYAFIYVRDEECGGPAVPCPLRQGSPI
jgi:hypothetical protein